MLLFYFVIFIFGLAMGSFINCLVCRMERGESFVKGRSYCPNCKHGLSWQDLIPLFSFFALLGRCRYCKALISWQYPLVELVIGIIFALVFYFNFPNLLITGYLLLISCFLIIIFIYDLKNYIIPDSVVYPAIAVSGIWYLVSSIFFEAYTKYEILNTVYSALGAAAFFLAIVLISKGTWMGIGDIKLAFLMGMLLPFPGIIVALFFAFFSGAIIGLGLIISKKKGLKSEVPFGPFLITGTFFALFWGENVANWYIKFLSY